MQRDGKFLFMAEYSMKKKTNFTLIQLAQESYVLVVSSYNCPDDSSVTHIYRGAPGASGVHPLMAYTERLRPKGVPLSGLK